MVKIISESSVAAGVRRIEAYTGARVEEMLDTIQDTLSDLKALFNNAPDLRIAIRKYLDENAGLKKQVEDFMKEKEAALPLISVFPLALVSSIVLSNKRIPVSKVRRNDSSSSLITFSISVFCATSSG